MLEKIFIPKKPFPEFKWQWASFAPTESINDPVVLLGVLFRMEKLEGRYSFSSDEFTHELASLSSDLNDSIGINLADRGGERNIMRNSQQYWKSLNLIPHNSRRTITLTDYGRKVARHEISQTEFAAITVMTHQLPNKNIQSESVCAQWRQAGIVLYPLKLILAISHETGYLTSKELRTIIIPLSAYPNCTVKDYVNFIKWYRSGEIDTGTWPDCCTRANDKRMAREFLLFLANYGYLIPEEGSNDDARFLFNEELSDEITTILNGVSTNPTIDEAIRILNSSDVVSDLERKKIQYSRRRPHQAQFRKEVLKACERCVITNVTLPEVLEAAHIKPFKYNGEDTIANGFAMRLDIHMLFDTGHLRIGETGIIDLSGRARLDYGSLIPPKIEIPDFINKDFIRWRWENYNGM
jgi:hypothetical protein